MNKIKDIGKNLLNKIQAHRYHLANKNKAKKILTSIESSKGKTDSKLIKLCDQYASDVLGWIGYSHWLYVYSAIAERFIEGWIPDNYYEKIVVPSLKGDYGKISDLKSLQSRIFASDLFPDIAYYANGLWSSSDYRVLSENNLNKTLFGNSSKIVYKIDSSLQGRGVFFFSKSDFNIDQIRKLGNGVVQEHIKQHKFFEEFMPNSVSTIRMTTYIDDSGNVTLRGCYLRIGRIEDSHVRSMSHIRIPINLNSGELYKYGFTRNWICIEKHPDTNIFFEKKTIPDFSKCISSVSELHKSMPFARTIGWDLVVDQNDNIKIMEWNGYHNDIKFSEATQGPCYSELGWEKLWKNNFN